MPNAEEIAIIQGLRAGGAERGNFEKRLWKLFSDFRHWGVSKYNLSADDISDAYADAICCVIDNIVSGRYKEEPNTLLKTYAVTIFHFKCMDRIKKNKNRSARYLKNPQPIKDRLLGMMSDDVKNVLEELIQKEDQSNLRKCLEQTGETCKEILLLYAGGYKDKEIAEILKYSSGDVAKQSRYRCIERLAEYYLNKCRNE